MVDGIQAGVGFCSTLDILVFDLRVRIVQPEGYVAMSSCNHPLNSMDKSAVRVSGVISANRFQTRRAVAWNTAAVDAKSASKFPSKSQFSTMAEINLLTCAERSNIPRKVLNVLDCGDVICVYEILDLVYIFTLRRIARVDFAPVHDIELG